MRIIAHKEQNIYTLKKKLKTIKFRKCTLWKNEKWMKFGIWRVKDDNNSWNELKNKIKFTKESKSVECGEKKIMIEATKNCKVR